MNRYHRPIKWIALLLTAVLLLSLAPTSFAAKKEEGTAYGLDGSMFCWVYATDTIPEGVEVVEASERVHMYQSSYVDESKKKPDEYVFDVTVTFVSGDERLKDAIQFRKSDDGENMYVYIDNSVITQPGEAVFHFVCEGENLRSEFDRTLRVLDYSENVPFAAKQEKAEFTFYPGDKLEPQKIAAAAVSDNVMSIAAGITDRKDYDYSPFSMLSYRHSSPGFSTGNEAFSSCFEYKDEQSDYNYKYWYEAVNPGTCTGEVSGTFNNVRLTVPVTLNVLGYALNGPDLVKPGETAEYTLVQKDNKDRSFVYTLEGEGATFEDGKLTAGSEGGTVTLIATPDTGEPAAKKQITISDGVLGVYQTTETTFYGFIFNRITDDSAGFEYGSVRGGYGAQLTDPETGAVCLYVNYVVYQSSSFLENPEDAVAFYDGELESEFATTHVLEKGNLDYDGHPVRYYLTDVQMDDGTTANVGYLFYARQNLHLMISVRTYVSDPSQTPAPVTLSDLQIAARGLSFDESGLDVVQSDGVITVTCKEDTHTVTAGKKLNFYSNFPRPEITYNADLNPITWSVVDAETGEASADVTITDKGVLTAGKNISSILNVKVIASSAVFHTQSEYEVTVMPVIKKVTLEPAEIFLYEGSDAEVTVTAKLDPDITPIGLTWTTKKEGVAEAKVNDDGTAVFKAVAAGKIQYTVKEPGGKTATLKVNVVAPVTGLTLSFKGKASPGKTVTITPAFEPKKPGNSSVEWSVNVGEDVATINNKGALKIAKDAAPGTVITVTCTALGAPEPVVATIEVTVE